MEQLELFDSPPKSGVDPQHVAFMHKDFPALSIDQARAMFAALGSFLQTVEVLKNGRR